jgi:hypothetical protein
MELLRFDALCQIDLGIENPLVSAECLSHGRAGRIDDHRYSPGRLLQDPQRLPAERRFDGVSQRLIDARRGHQAAATL